jgi:hypothetical protein
MIIPDILPDNHVVAESMKYWVNLIDKKVRESNPELTRTVPKPKVKVINSKQVNAWVAPAAACVEAEIVFSQGIIDQMVASIDPGVKINFVQAKDLSLEYDRMRILGDISYLSMDGPSSKPTCVQAKYGESLGDFVKFFNQQSTTCKLMVSPDQKKLVVSGEKCLVVDASFGSRRGPPPTGCENEKVVNVFTGAKTARFNSTSNVFIMTTGIIAGINKEEEVVSVVAHELGHYYRAHVTTMNDKAYNYFYQQEEQPTLQKPPVHPA